MDNLLKEDWKNYKFKLIEKSEYPKVLEHLRETFYVDEPISGLLGLTPERIADMDQRMRNILDLEHGSFYAYPANQPEMIAATLIIWYQKKGIELPHFEARSPLTEVLRRATVQFGSLYNTHEARGVDVYPEIYMISTDREHREKGLATEMYRRAIKKFRQEGHRLVSSTFTNPYSRKIGEKFGFKPVCRMSFDEITNEDGSPYFGKAGEEHFVVDTVLDL